MFQFQKGMRAHRHPRHALHLCQRIVAQAREGGAVVVRGGDYGAVVRVRRVVRCCECGGLRASSEQWQ